MTLARETRDAADEHPFLLSALRAGVVNYSAAARFLAVDGEAEAVATALRRYADALPEFETGSRDVRVTMQSGIGPVPEAADDEPLLRVSEQGYGKTAGGESTAILATGAVDAAFCQQALGQLETDDVGVSALGFDGGALVVLVGRREAANALRAVEAAAEAVREPARDTP
ncbi:hypothetical protein [Haloarchaeobius sp. HME9146]|uniref:DUF7523 family protein n=1 Tax=Haloarchaeobius sp. HME9146 TaxID=2978732 RepID=UPI0021C22DD1|nr:hypothetical protein [Haloarchaeobius sp. HME9146]MCT9096837.1 hypothetical protein [Haloarchaeobius sp. HME9146]